MYWICQCDCGNFASIRGDNLVRLDTLSCGCYHKEVGSKKSTNKKYNKVEFDNEACIIYTSKNEKIYIDAEDYDKVKDYCWSVAKNGYAVARCGIKDAPILMHRIIMDAKEEDVIDHRNHEILNNRKTNLRLCDNYKNMANQSLSKANTSGFKGVYWDKEKELWNVKIGYNNKQIHIGYYSDYEKAIEARMKAEEEYFKEYSYYKSIKEN